MPEPRMLFGNFICHFGETILVDYLDEIVVPAFLDDTLIRTYGETTQMFFYGMKVGHLPAEGKEPVAAIYGRFVKNSTLQRSHRFEKQYGLISDDAALESAAFAFFVLILHNHKLLYLPETSYPPDLSTFAATAAHHFRVTRTRFINHEYQRLKSMSEAVTKKLLSQQHPKPHVECVPLASRSSIEEFLNKYAQLRQIEFKLLTPNQESSAKRWWEKMREMKHDIGSQHTTLSHKSKDGLDVTEAESQIHDGASSGNQSVKLDGVDHEGNKLRGNNESFQYTISMPDLSDNDDEGASAMYKVYEQLIKSKALTIDESRD